MTNLLFFKNGLLLEGYFSAEILTFFTFLLCNGTLLIFFRYFQLSGILAYSTVAIIVSNLHVLKTASFTFLSEPVALGTVVFSSLYLCSDMVTEFYGPQKARQIIHVNFMALILMGVLMLLALGHAPLNSPRDQQVHQAIKILFLPTPSLIAASLIAYMVSQYNDVWIFSYLRQVTGHQMLWLRTTFSTLISGFVDTVIFSILAWVVFAPYPMSWKTLIWTYIFGTFWLRALISLLHTPLIYIAKRLHSSPS